MSTDLILIPIVTVLFCSASTWLLYRDIEHKWPDEIKERWKKVAAVYSTVMLAITVGIAILFLTVFRENTIWTRLKIIVLICSVWPIALIDFKTMRIPNSLILLGAIGRVALIPFELLFSESWIWSGLLSEVIAAGALIVAALLCTLVIKNSVGFGDFKLFALMGVTLGLDGIWSAIFIALVASFVIALVLLITKRKSKKDAIPFGPAIVFGIYLSVCLTGL